MSAYLPDTNTVSGLMRNLARVQERVTTEVGAGSRIYLSHVVEYETRRGLIRSRSMRLTGRFETIIRDFQEAPLALSAWVRAAELWAYCRDRGSPFEDTDILIAAHALELSAVLVTDNTRHFRPFEPLGLQLENWVTPAP